MGSSFPNGLHNYINTRADLFAYDATLYQLIQESFAEADITLRPP